MGSRTGAIPISQREKQDGWVPNPRDLSTTPGGTIYATTPGGTRIVYDRQALMLLRQSPLSKTPTKLPYIPGVTGPEESNAINTESPAQQRNTADLQAGGQGSKKDSAKSPNNRSQDAEGMFEMDS